MLARKLQEHYWRDRQSWHYEALYEVGSGKTSGARLERPRVVRIRIERNAFDFQSTAAAHTWTERGWVEVASIPYPEMRVCLARENGASTVCYISDKLDDTARDLFVQDGEVLLHESKLILSYAEPR